MLDVGINWFTANLYNRVVEFNRLGLINQKKTSLPLDTYNIPALVIKQSKFSILEKLLIIKTGEWHNIKLKFRIIGNIRQQDTASVLAIQCDYLKPNHATATNPYSRVTMGEPLLIILYINELGVIIANMYCDSQIQDEFITNSGVGFLWNVGWYRVHVSDSKYTLNGHIINVINVLHHRRHGY